MFKKKEKAKFIDDGRSLTDMNVEGMPYYNKNKRKNSRENIEPLTKKERRQLIMEAYKAYLPMLIVCIVGFTLVYLFFKYLWIR